MLLTLIIILLEVERYFLHLFDFNFSLFMADNYYHVIRNHTSKYINYDTNFPSSPASKYCLQNTNHSILSLKMTYGNIIWCPVLS